MIDPFERARQLASGGPGTTYPSLSASREIRVVLAIMLGRAEAYKAALEEIANDSYLCDHDLDFKPTQAALKAQAALSLKIGSRTSAVPSEDNATGALK